MGFGGFSALVLSMESTLQRRVENLLVSKTPQAMG